jgi:acyl-CoA synthetase (AMP-forming)/AMP-acid ligase II
VIDTELRSIGDLLRRRAVNDPGATAMECEGRTTTLTSLDRRANQVANGLIEALPRVGDRAAVLDGNSDTFFELLFGAAKANRVLVPLNNRLVATEIVEVVKDAGAQLLFVGADFLPVAEAIARDCRNVKWILTFGGQHEGWDGYASWRDRQPDADPATAVDRSDVMLLCYTSGTTGKPKGAQLTHENLLANAPLLLQEYGSSPGTDVALVCMPLFHVSGSLWALSCLYAAVPILILPRVTPVDLLAAIAGRRVTKALLVPVVIQMLVDASDREAYDLSSLTFILYGASPISETLLRRAMATLSCDFGQVYGLTETAGAITYLAPADHDLANPRRLQSCGKPLGHVEIRIVDERGAAVREPGRVGEIVCRTAQNMKGYWNNPQETAAVLRDGWLHTGDAGYFDEGGYLYIHDRLKDMIISGGENIYPADVERALAGHAAVADVAVIGVPDDRWGEVPKAFVVTKNGQQVTPEELIEFCRGRIAAYKLPKSVEFVTALKRNPAGKLLKYELRAPYWAGRTRKVN